MKLWCSFKTLPKPRDWISSWLVDNLVDIVRSDIRINICGASCYLRWITGTLRHFNIKLMQVSNVICLDTFIGTRFFNFNTCLPSSRSPNFNTMTLIICALIQYKLWCNFIKSRIGNNVTHTTIIQWDQDSWIPHFLFEETFIDMSL